MHKPLDAGSIQLAASIKILQRLINYGVENIILSPGSRSTPLVLASDLLSNKFDNFVSIDERSAAFMALAMARQSTKPIALICTSGSAPAHYYPAIIEANLQSWPIIALTADRPPSLIGSGSNQTIDQRRIFGEHACYLSYHPLQQNEQELTQTLLELEKCLHTGQPIQFNLHFEKPLEPQNSNLGYGQTIKALDLNQETHSVSSTALDESDFDTSSAIEIFTRLKQAKRPICIAGPYNDPEAFRAFYTWAAKCGAPLLMEHASGYLNILGKNPWHPLIHQLDSTSNSLLSEADFIIRSGQSPTHRATLKLLDQLKGIDEITFSGKLRYVQNPSLKSTIFDFKNVPSQDFWHEITLNIDQDWANRIRKSMHEFVALKRKRTEDIFAQSTIVNEAFFLDQFGKLVPSDHDILLSNSLMARDFDYFIGRQLPNKVYSMRAASGIDGWIAQAVGHALKSKKPTHLLIGDVAFQHDAGSLELINRYRDQIDLNIWLLNNKGGRIFDRLPISKQVSAQFLDTYFHTQPLVDFGTLCRAYSISYRKFEYCDALREYLNEDSTQLQTIIEISCDSAISDQLRTLST